MANNHGDSLQLLIDRLLAGDEAARSELLCAASHRLRMLAGKMMNESFPVLRGKHELDSIVHETWIRLEQALKRTEPPTVGDFFRLAAHKIRQVLLDFVAAYNKGQHRERLGLGNSSVGEGPMHALHDTFNPARLTEWTEFHESVASLPDEERTVFEMHYYLGVKQVDIGRLLQVHPNRINFLWMSARERLADALRLSDDVD